MCKVMMMAGISSDTRENAWKFIKEMAKEMTPSNVDGLGYAAVSTGGDLFGERWHNNAEAFTTRTINEPLTQLDNYLIKAYKGVLRKDQPPVKYNRFGSIAEDSIAAITLHTRMATSGKEFFNTHPFVDGDTSLIHNGIIRNPHEIGLKQSTCDSEAILNLYVKHKIASKPENMKVVASRLQGYYACGVFTKDKEQGYVLDVFKCSNAVLGAAFVQELNTVVFSTRISDIKSVCGRLGFTVLSEFIFESDKLVRINAITGEAVMSVDFDVPLKQHAVQSVGKKEKKKLKQLPKVREWSEQVPESRQWLYRGDWWDKNGDES